MPTKKWLYERITRSPQTTILRGFTYTKPVKAIMLADGESISVQASEVSYCTPREDVAAWQAVECGFPSFHPSPKLMEYCENPERPTETIYAYVPVDIVLAEIEAHGGIDPDDSPSQQL